MAEQKSIAWIILGIVTIIAIIGLVLLFSGAGATGGLTVVTKKKTFATPGGPSFTVGPGQQHPPSGVGGGPKKVPSLLRTFGTTGVGPGQFSGPNGLAFEASGTHVFVSDATAIPIQKFVAATGAFVQQIGARGFGPGLFSFPDSFRIAVSPTNGDILVGKKPAQLEVFDNTGTFKTSIGGFSGNPFGVEVDNSGNIYAIDTVGHKVNVYNAAGGFLFSFGSQGSGPGQFNFPRDGIEIDDSLGRVIVNDLFNFRVSVWDKNGNFLFDFGSQGTADGQFSFPNGITVDSQSRIYVGDTGQKRVQVFDANGNFLFAFGSGTLPGVTDVEIHKPTQEIYVVESASDLVWVFSAAS